jgi:DNA-binding response OmpR family regulator
MRLAAAAEWGILNVTLVRILIIEDEAKTAQAIRRGLRGEGYDALVARTGEEGLSRLEAEAFDLVVLDWRLPGCDGISILRSLRARGTRPPVLLLTARDAVEDRVRGLDSGADDYLLKPFAFAELLARVRALLRRAGPEEPFRRQIGDLVLDPERRRAVRGGQEIALTPREFDLLAYLMRHQGEIVTRHMLARDVWREPNRATPLDNVIDVHLAHLRKKVDEGRGGRLIHTVRGVGIVLREEVGP